MLQSDKWFSNYFYLFKEFLLKFSVKLRRIQEYSNTSKANNNNTQQSLASNLNNTSKRRDIKKTMSSPSSIITSSANAITGKVSALIYSNHNTSTYNSVVLPLAQTNTVTPSNTSGGLPSIKSKHFFNLQALSNRLNRFTK